MNPKINEELFQEIMKLKRRVRQAAQSCNDGNTAHNACKSAENGKAEERPAPQRRERILRFLLSRENGLRQKRLCEMMGVGAPAMSETIERLESDGYIERIPDMQDKRAVRICLSEKGKERAEEIQNAHEVQINELFKNLGEDEKAQLMELLKKINA